MTTSDITTVVPDAEELKRLQSLTAEQLASGLFVANAPVCRGILCLGNVLPKLQSALSMVIGPPDQPDEQYSVKDEVDAKLRQK